MKFAKNLFAFIGKMLPKPQVELLVARFAFVTHVHPQYPLVTMTRKKHSPSGSMTVVRDWFDRIVSAEKSKLPPNTVLRFVEYHIVTGDMDLFKIGGSRFDRVILVLCEEISYWVFYKNVSLHRRVEGEGALPLSFCSCCFQTHFERVMKTIKDSYCSPRSVKKV